MKIYDQGRLVRDLIPVAKGDKVYDYVMPEDGLFDLITEIFFGNSNQGGKYEMDINKGITYIDVNIGSNVLKTSFAANDRRGCYQAILSLTESDI